MTGRDRLRGKAAKTLLKAFPHTLPVLAGYAFLGMAFGVLLQSQGYGALWAGLMSVVIYAGSMQFVAVGLLAAGFAPVHTALLTLMVNARHIFYGLAMLARYRDFGRAKPYMVFALTDETFSLLLSAKPPDGVDRRMFDVCVAALNQCYWVLGSIAGALLGEALTIDTKGIEFVMTALFIVIFLSQWQTREGRLPAIIGIGIAAACLFAFGSGWFLPPTMAALIVALLALRQKKEGTP